MDSSVNYHIKGPNDNNNSVEAWSKKRLPFEPKDWLLEMRNSLRDAIENIAICDDELLYAVFNSEDDDSVDAENVLFYNVGPGAFKHLCQKGLLFERGFEKPPEMPEDYGFSAKYHQRYAVGKKENPSTKWEKEKRLAYWNELSCPIIRVDTKPHTYWQVMKKGDVSIEGKILAPKFYGMNLKIKAPSGTKINLASVMKPLLDGIISSFHAHDGSNISTVTTRLAKHLDEDESYIEKMLEETNTAVLGTVNLIRPYRENFQWYPADDFCTYAEITIDDCYADDNWSISGEIFTMKNIQSN